MSRIFISHSSANNAEAIALRDWLVAEGWNDLFLDLDPARGIAAGERWARRLNEAASRCEAVLFLVSKAWIASGWCRKEFSLAHRLNKRLIGVLIEDLTVEEVPKDLSGDWQLVRLVSGRDHVMLRAVLPVTHEEVHITFSAEGLQRLKHGLELVGIDAKYFAWPPASDPNRPPYRGLRPLETDDAGIFFGRDAPVISALDALRGLRDAAPPRILVILGASGAGKSSFLRAGLLPRLIRDDRHFLPLPIVRPERAALTGETGLLRALEGAFEAARLPIPRADLRAAMHGGAATLRPLLQTLAAKMTPVPHAGEPTPKPPTLIVSIDQSEELFLAEAEREARPFLALLRGLLAAEDPAVITLFTIRSDNYERLQDASELEGFRQATFSLQSMPKGSYAEVIKGPARRLEGTARALKIDDDLVDALLADVEGDSKDALPLLAFTLERLYSEFRGGAHLQLEHYNRLGRVQGSIEAAVERAFQAANRDGRIPRDRDARLMLLRRGVIPWLAGLDPDTGAPRRRVTRLSEVPQEARPLIDLLVEQRLLSADVAEDSGETTIEPAHEALLRQWRQLQEWLREDARLLGQLDAVKRASSDWCANDNGSAWLTHTGARLQAAEELHQRSDLAAALTPADMSYLTACRAADKKARGRARAFKAIVTASSLLLAAVGAGWWKQDILKQQYQWHMVMGPKVLTPEQERALKAGDLVSECAVGCPQLVVVPPGRFVMGSPDVEPGRGKDEGPQHEVTIKHKFAVGRFEVTFAQWDMCVAATACPFARDAGWGRGERPVINVSREDAMQYAAWLTRLTGRTYRLLSESEWEYAARAGNSARYSFGESEAELSEHAWFAGNSEGGTQPVGRKKPNAFGLYDMHGNVWEWVEDRWHSDYTGAPTDGTAWLKDGNPSRHVLRGGAWDGRADLLRSANRNRPTPDSRNYYVGFRVGRSLTP